MPGCSGVTTAGHDYCYLPASELKMTIVATNVNKTSVVAANWQTTKSLTTKMLSSTTAIGATSTIWIRVVPCAITAATIATVITDVGDKVETAAHPVFTYTNIESTLALCGPITYELVGGNTNSLTYDTSTRKFTFQPKTTTLIGNNTSVIRAKSTNFPLNTKDKNFTVTGRAPCTSIGYSANRGTIKTQPSIETYHIGVEGTKTLSFSFVISPTSCVPKFTKEYIMAV